MSNNLQADELLVAVASNFSHTLKLLSHEFNSKSGHHLRISSASTGKLYAQIQHGAPFDVFLSADEKHPGLLIDENKAVASSAYVYAKGRLVLISNLHYSTEACHSVLMSQELKRLSIANPATAPYGLAAKQVLEELGLWEEIKPRLVMGENVAQALLFVSTRNAQAGFVAKSMLSMGKAVDTACTWDVPSAMYAPINQKMVVLNKAKDKAAAQEFMQFIRSVQAKEIIRAAGYDVL